jgi:peptidyl-prolyl cis-trans isomerase D
MPSRDFRRAQNKKTDSVADAIQKKHSMHPLVYIGTVVTLVIIVFAFVLVGPGGPLGRGGAGGPGNIVFGTYEGHDIAYYQGSYFAQERDRLANQMRNQGQQDTRAAAQMVWYQAFISTAEHVAILLQAEKAGVNVSEDAVDKALLNYPGYMDDSGRFSETRYAATAAADREATRKLTRESLLTNIFASDIVTGVKIGSQEVDFVKSMAGSERSFTFISWPFSSFPNDAVRAYAEANKARFLHIKLSRILIKSGESQAKEIHKKILDKTSTFEELAKTYSKDEFADKGGDMGWRYAYDVEADFDAKETAEKVLTLKGGELSEVLKGTFGWLIYRCDSEAIAPDFNSTTVLDDVKSYLNRYEKGKVEDYFNGKATQLAARAAVVGFDKAAAEAGLKVASTELFPVNLGNVFSFAPLRANPDTETPPNAAYNEDFFVKAFSLARDKVSAPVVLDDRILVMKVKEEKQLPEATANLLGSWIGYIANQSVQADLAAALMTPDRLKDNFSTVFDQYVMPASRRQ